MTAGRVAPRPSAELTFGIEFHGPFRIGRGESSSGADATVDRDDPLPASSLKGLMRATAAQDLGVDRSWITSIFGPPAQVGEPAAGTPPVPGTWCWTSASFRGTTPKVGRSARIRMDSNGAVTDGALQIGEQHWAREATFTVRHLGPLSEQDLSAHRLILRAAARAIGSLGGQRRRGQGWVTVTDTEPWTDDDSARLLDLGPRPIPPASPVQAANAVDEPGSGEFVRLTFRMVTTAVISAGVGAEVGNAQRGHLVIPGSTIRGALAASWMNDHGLTDADSRMAALFERDLSVGPAVPVGSRLESASARRQKYGTGVLPMDVAQEYVKVHGGGVARPEIRPADGGRGWNVPPDRRVSTTRTALTEQGPAVPGQLYTAAGIRVGTVLVGELLVPAGDDAVLGWLRQPRSLRVGGRRSVGGSARFSVVGSTDTVGVGPRTDPADLVVVRCRTAAILVDALGAPTTDIQAVLRRDLREPRLQVKRRWLRTTKVEGWHMASGLPKPADLAVEAGSVLVVSGLTTQAAQRLAQGIGLRRQEGFGRVEIVPTDEPPFGRAVVDPAPDPVDTPIATGPADTEPLPASPTLDETEPMTADVKTGTGGSAPTDPETQPSQDDPFVDLLALVPESEKDLVLAGLENQARRIAVFRSSGMDPVAVGTARSAVKLPWLRGQAQRVQDLVVQLLSSPEITRVRDRVALERGGRS